MALIQSILGPRIRLDDDLCRMLQLGTELSPVFACPHEMIDARTGNRTFYI
jgi:hypothetical protein